MRGLRQWRLDRLLSVEELASIAGVSNKTIIQIEHGRQLPRLRTIRRLSEALQVEPNDVSEFNQALDELGKGRALINPGRSLLVPVAAATAAGPSAV
jgi:transcriptional regulator with XRE-family HTH domain